MLGSLEVFGSSGISIDIILWTLIMDGYNMPWSMVHGVGYLH